MNRIEVVVLHYNTLAAMDEGMPALQVTEDKITSCKTLHRRPAVRKKVSSHTGEENPLEQFLDKRIESVEPQYAAIKELKLHYPENPEKLLKNLKGRNFDLVQRDHNGYTPLHAIVSSGRCDRIECLLVLMVHSEFGTVLINMPGGKNEQTALHMAVQLKDIDIIKILLVFGADINATDGSKQTPLDVVTAEGMGSCKPVLSVLKLLDAKLGQDIKTKSHSCQRSRLWSISSLSSLNKSCHSIKTGGTSTHCTLEEYMADLEIAQKLEKHLATQFFTYNDIWDHHFQFALGLQQFELQGWKTTCNPMFRFQVEGGSRVLFLDGGGMRGLIQIEILTMLEQCTGRQITDLFDWIIGTSTGGIVALGLVYGKKSLAELRQVYFRLKEDIFSKSGFGIGYNTDALESILKENFDSNIRMSDISEPKVLISAVMKKTTNLQLTFFNNCFDDEFSSELVWKVARYTSAAPMNFSECDGYVDGGVLANNPSEYGLTAIQNHHRLEGIRLNICCVVSVGTGKFPAEALGSTDAHEGIFHLLSLKKKASNLMTLISKALVESEDVANNSRSRCREQHIPFYRFSPNLESEVQSGETDVKVLVEMLMKTKFQIEDEWRNEIKDLKMLFSRMESYDESKRHQRLKDKRQRHAFRLKDIDEDEIFD